MACSSSWMVCEGSVPATMRQKMQLMTGMITARLADVQRRFSWGWPLSGQATIEAVRGASQHSDLWRLSDLAGGGHGGAILVKRS